MKITKTDIIADLLFLMGIAVCITLVVCGYAGAEAPETVTCEPTTAATIEETIEPTQIPTVTETTPETTAEATEETTQPIETEPPVILYDVPLDESLQLHIIETAEDNGIDPAIIFAMAYRESTYRPGAIGDGGNSFGLLQIQPRWHSERMQRLGCPDLLDPFQNVTVGVDYLAELLNRYGDIAAALTAYNRGHYAGTVTQYAWTVLAKAEELRGECK